MQGHLARMQGKLNNLTARAPVILLNGEYHLSYRLSFAAVVIMKIFPRTGMCYGLFQHGVADAINLSFGSLRSDC